MELFKVIILGVVIAFISVLLKQIKPEYSIIAIVVGSVIMLFFIVNSILKLFDFFGSFVDKTGIDGNLFLLLYDI